MIDALDYYNYSLGDMKKFLEQNLNRQAQELMEVQGLLKESDHENRQLNRQVLKLLQENTRLKMQKVQNSIVSMPSECRRTVQKICSKHIEQYNGHSRQRKAEVSPQIGRLKISMHSNNTPARDQQNQAQMAVAPREQGQNQQSEFFTFGGNKRNPITQYKRQQISSQLQYQQRSKDRSNDKLKPPKPDMAQIEAKQQQATIPQNHQQLSSKDNSVPKRLRTVHSIRPSPQITPQRDLSRLPTTPTKTSKQLQSQLNDPAHQASHVPSSIEKKKKYIDIVSVFLTPTRSGK